MTQIITSRWGWQWWGGGWDGDMKKAVYDPQNIGKDAFDYDNFTNTPTIPTEVSELDNDAWYITSAALSGYQTTSNLVTNLTNPDDTHYPSAKAVSDAITSSGGWDMLKSVYDPDNIEANAFDYDNFINTPTIPTDTSDLTNGAGYITGIDSSDVTTALWYTPYNSTNPSGYITGISSWDVTTALGYTPYNSTNPSGYVTSSIISNTAYWSGWNWDTTHAPTKDAVYDKINSIDWLIPSAATSSNKLTDKNYVDDSINSVTAYYITKNAAWDQWASYAELAAATTFYSWWVVRTPTRNDYTIVLDDENHDHATTRYIYNTNWEYQYTVNETPLTQAQLDALNSWITSAKVSTYDWYATSKQDALTAGTGIDITSNTVSTASNFGTSSTAAATVQKEVSIPWITTLNVGQVVHILPSTTSTVANSTLKVNNFTAYPMRYNNAAITTSTDSIVRPANIVTSFVFDWTYWQFIGHWLDSNTTYSNMSAAEANAWTSGTTRTINASVLKWAIQTHAPVQSVNWSTGAVTVSEFTPWWTATTGYVVTKTASGYEWQAPSGWDVMVSTQANNILTSWMKIWAWTQANYESLGTYDNNTVYLTI